MNTILSSFFCRQCFCECCCCPWRRRRSVPYSAAGKNHIQTIPIPGGGEGSHITISISAAADPDAILQQKTVMNELKSRLSRLMEKKAIHN